MALNANALTTRAFAKTYLKIASAETSLDELVDFWVNVASQKLEAWTMRKLKAQALTEYHHGRDSNILMLREWPIQASPFPQVFIDGSAVFGASTEVPAAEIRIGDDSNTLVFLSRQLPNGYQNIKTVYTGGYAAVPADLENACLWLVSWYHAARDNKDIGRTAKTKGDETISFSQDMPKDVRDTIGMYKRCEAPAAWAPVRNT